MSPESMPRLSRREQTRQAARQRIMDEGRKLFAEKGYDAATMRDVAKATQYTPSALYYHFKDKAELMHAICTEDFLGLTHRFQAVMTSANPLDNVKNLGRAYAEFALDYPNHYRLMFMTRHPLGPTPKDQSRMGDPEQDAYALLHRLVALAMEQDLLRPDLTDAHLVAQTFWGGVHGLITLQLDKGCDHWVPWTDIHARIDLMCDVLSRGVERA
ncbi:TetR/AcrR family transcriptional regulator [Geothrix sp. PMB-07]|uniref:TetR/AcrR family transcriptional regulator n=1 Tax=Geothrix sp. PMB-07 TaxID=3068640 RepID=UPI0027407E6A|nr:TetR/AcrR family transcriptional regulator [Geothrix sp. PMB-07]WLT30982.1 TetR/AcrR family transcriptional regulator [Geothrix sp. PMB-07]